MYVVVFRDLAVTSARSLDLPSYENLLCVRNIISIASAAADLGRHETERRESEEFIYVPSLGSHSCFSNYSGSICQFALR